LPRNTFREKLFTPGYVGAQNNRATVLEAEPKGVGIREITVPQIYNSQNIIALKLSTILPLFISDASRQFWVHNIHQ